MISFPLPEYQLSPRKSPLFRFLPRVFNNLPFCGLRLPLTLLDTAPFYTFLILIDRMCSMTCFHNFYIKNHFLNLAYTYPEDRSIMSAETLVYTYETTYCHSIECHNMKLNWVSNSRPLIKELMSWLWHRIPVPLCYSYICQVSSVACQISSLIWPCDLSLPSDLLRDHRRHFNGQDYKMQCP
jgi:hypothetical protein